MNYTVHGILQARTLEWVAFPFSRGPPLPRDWPRSPALQVDSLLAEPQEKPKNTGVGSLSLLQPVFPIHEWNWGLLHCRWILYQLNYQGNGKGRKICTLLVLGFALRLSGDQSWEKHIFKCKISAIAKSLSICKSLLLREEFGLKSWWTTWAWVQEQRWGSSWWFIHSFIKYLFNTYCVSGTALSAWETSVSKINNSFCSCGRAGLRGQPESDQDTLWVSEFCCVWRDQG